MIRFTDSLDAATFAKKHPKSHVIVGRYDPAHVIEQHEPTRLGMLMTVINALDIVGEYNMSTGPEPDTVRLSFETVTDAEKLARIVHAKPEPTAEGCASKASFRYSRRAYRNLGYVRAKRIREIEAAILRGEG